MPKVVDHEQRRAELLTVVWRVIARDGLDGVTMRSLSAETGWSSGVLQHYFSGKRDIVVSAHRLAYERAGERIEARIRGLRARDALRVALLEALPLDEERLVEARVEVSAWSLAMNDPEFLAIREESLQAWRSLLVDIIAAARANGDVHSPMTDDLLAHEVLALVDAMSVQAVLFPALATPRRQVELADALLGRILTGDA
ncbi:TetR/AcrR family transcriptional regulator [Gordonia sp. NPDC003376]